MTKWTNGEHSYEQVDELAVCEQHQFPNEGEPSLAILSSYHLRDDGQRSCPMCYAEVRAPTIRDVIEFVNRAIASEAAQAVKTPEASQEKT